MSRLVPTHGACLLSLVAAVLAGAACSSIGAAPMDAGSGAGSVGTGDSSTDSGGDGFGGALGTGGSACSNRTRQLPLGETFLADFEDG
ncbi:MAG TPA: hypothetical protein VFH73_08115, partial [Polyangia bacterium]|nr:hypothetical protein [Polyangia bacterium]